MFATSGTRYAATIGTRGMSGRADLRVDEAIRDVHEEICDDVGRGREEDDPLHERVVLLEDRLDRELPDALPREHGLDDDAAREQPTQLQPDDRDEWAE